VRIGAIKVHRDFGDSAQAKFVEYDRDAFLRSVSIFGMPPFGTCTVNPQTYLSIFTEPESDMDERMLSDPRGLVNRLLDAGPQLSATNIASYHTLNPEIDLTMRANGAGAYYGTFFDPTHPRSAEVLLGGSLQVKGPGGSDVGVFHADQRFGDDPQHAGTWAASGSENWIPGEPSPELLWTYAGGVPLGPETYSEIQLLGGQVMLCTVAPGIGKFQVPGFVTLGIALRGSDGSAYIHTVGPHIGLSYLPVRFTAQGIDIGVFFSRSYN